MKRQLVVLTLFASLSLVANAQDVEVAPAYLSTRTIQACDFWSFISTDRGSGYMCSMYPMSVTVPDTMALEATIVNLESRIEALENRLNSLQK